MQTHRTTSKLLVGTLGRFYELLQVALAVTTKLCTHLPFRPMIYLQIVMPTLPLRI